MACVMPGLNRCPGVSLGTQVHAGRLPSNLTQMVKSERRVLSVERWIKANGIGSCVNRKKKMCSSKVKRRSVEYR